VVKGFCLLRSGSQIFLPPPRVVRRFFSFGILILKGMPCISHKVSHKVSSLLSISYIKINKFNYGIPRSSTFSSARNLLSSSSSAASLPFSANSSFRSRNLLSLFQIRFSLFVLHTHRKQLFSGPFSASGTDFHRECCPFSSFEPASGCRPALEADGYRQAPASRV
jgi:hypothetical protein